MIAFFVYLFYTVDLNENHLHYSAKNIHDTIFTKFIGIGRVL